MIDQVAYWNGKAGERWADEQTMLDAMLQPFGRAALDAARVGRGEKVLDVGCGCGDSSLALASLVGSGGRVVGLDVSAPMLARARERAGRAPPIDFVLGDATKEPFPRGDFDLIFSRFGVMFFSDPVAAFSNVRAALRAGGRMVFACWRSVGDNPWATVPYEAAVGVLGRPEPEPPDAPGPFSLGDPARVRRILVTAGFHEPLLLPFEGTMAFGGPERDAATEIARIGPVARLLVDRDDTAIASVITAVRTILGPYLGASGEARFPAATWIVSAENPP